MQFINRNSELSNNEFDGAIELQDLTGQSSLINNNPIEPFYYDASGSPLRRKVKKAKGAIRKNVKGATSYAKQSGSNIANRRQERKMAKIGAKQTQAKASLAAAKGLGKSDPTLAAALSQPAPVAEKSNTALYVGLGVAGLALIGTVIYFIAKKKK